MLNLCYKIIQVFTLFESLRTVQPTGPLKQKGRSEVGRWSLSLSLSLCRRILQTTSLSLRWIDFRRTRGEALRRNLQSEEVAQRVSQKCLNSLKATQVSLKFIWPWSSLDNNKSKSLLDKMLFVALDAEESEQQRCSWLSSGSPRSQARVAKLFGINRRVYSV